VPEDLVDHLRELAAREGTDLVPVLSDDHRLLVVHLTELASSHQDADPGARADQERWTVLPAAPAGGAVVGTVPRDDPGHDAVPPDRAPEDRLSADDLTGARQTFLLLATRTDEPLAWLRSGEALERLMLELTRLGWSAGPLTQAMEVPLTRSLLRSVFTGEGHPQSLLRIGRTTSAGSAPRRPRTETVHIDVRPPRPAAVPPDPPSATGRTGSAAVRRRPVSDGRGGTTWL
jgi:hypothetical protein